MKVYEADVKCDVVFEIAINLMQEGGQLGPQKDAKPDCQKQVGNKISNPSSTFQAPPLQSKSGEKEQVSQQRLEPHPPEICSSSPSERKEKHNQYQAQSQGTGKLGMNTISTQVDVRAPEPDQEMEQKKLTTQTLPLRANKEQQISLKKLKEGDITTAEIDAKESKRQKENKKSVQDKVEKAQDSKQGLQKVNQIKQESKLKKSHAAAQDENGKVMDEDKDVMLDENSEAMLDENSEAMLGEASFEPPFKSGKEQLNGLTVIKQQKLEESPTKTLTELSKPQKMRKPLDEERKLANNPDILNDTNQVHQRNGETQKEKIQINRGQSQAKKKQSQAEHKSQECQGQLNKQKEQTQSERDGIKPKKLEEQLSQRQFRGQQNDYVNQSGEYYQSQPESSSRRSGRDQANEDIIDEQYMPNEAIAEMKQLTEEQKRLRHLQESRKKFDQRLLCLVNSLPWKNRPKAMKLVQALKGSKQRVNAITNKKILLKSEQEMLMEKAEVILQEKKREVKTLQQQKAALEQKLSKLNQSNKKLQQEIKAEEKNEFIKEGLNQLYKLSIEKMNRVHEQNQEELKKYIMAYQCDFTPHLLQLKQIKEQTEEQFLRSQHLKEQLRELDQSYYEVAAESKKVYLGKADAENCQLKSLLLENEFNKQRYKELKNKYASIRKQKQHQKGSGISGILMSNISL